MELRKELWQEVLIIYKFTYLNHRSIVVRDHGRDSVKQLAATVLFIYLFVFPGLVTLSIIHTEKLHCCRNITS